MRFFIRGRGGLDELEAFAADLKRLTAYEYFESVPPKAGSDEERARARFSRELDYAYFAARLGWTPSQYESLTQIERLFVRKELELVTVERANTLQEAVKLAFVNAWNGKNYQLFKRRVERDESITDEDVKALVAACEKKRPWVPWSV